MPYADFAAVAPSSVEGAWTYRGLPAGAGREHRPPAARADPGRRQLGLPPRRRGAAHRAAARPDPARRRPTPRRDPARLVRDVGDGRTAARAPAARPMTSTVGNRGSAKPLSLTARTVRGFVWAFTGSAGQAVLQIAATIVLARLLTPQEFGSVAAALLVVGLAQLLTQVGVSAALVQRRELTDDDVSAAFAFSVLVALVLAGALAAGAPVLSPLVGLPTDSGLLLLLAPTLAARGRRCGAERAPAATSAVPAARRRRPDRGRARDDRCQRGVRPRRFRCVRAGVGVGRRRDGDRGRLPGAGPARTATDPARRGDGPAPADDRLRGRATR